MNIQSSNYDYQINHWFIQTQPTPVEGAHAQEVTRDEFLLVAEKNPNVSITFDEINSGLYLRFDLALIDIV